MVFSMYLTYPVDNFALEKWGGLVAHKIFTTTGATTIQ